VPFIIGLATVVMTKGVVCGELFLLGLCETAEVVAAATLEAAGCACLTVCAIFLSLLCLWALAEATIVLFEMACSSSLKS
jgi:hypothetical protein